MKREVSAAEPVLIFVFCAAGYAALGVFHPSFSAIFVGGATLIVVEPLLVLVHELGHAAAAVHVTRRPATVRAGRPPYSRHFSIGRVRVAYSARGYVGRCEFDRSVPITGGGMLLIALTGPAANLLIATLLAGIAYLSEEPQSRAAEALASGGVDRARVRQRLLEALAG